MSEPSDQELGLNAAITRRDFLNATLLGTGSSLLQLPAPLARVQQDGEAAAFDGFGGTGDYALSNGNTWDVVQAGHALRDGRFDRRPSAVRETGETYDLLVVGGGFSGAGAAYAFHKRRTGTVLILDNHRMWGGEAKRNEFMVDGVRLIGPQGSNDFGIPGASRPAELERWKDLGLPTNPDDYQHQEWASGITPLTISRDHYYQLFWDEFDSNGYFFDQGGGRPPRLVRDPFRHLEATPWSEKVRQDFVRARTGMDRPSALTDRSEIERWLDTMSYETYLTGVLGLDPAIPRYLDPLVASGFGVGCDLLSAVTPSRFALLPGFNWIYGKAPDRRYVWRGPASFPGGNDGLYRHFIKWLVPDAIAGGRTFDEIQLGPVRRDALDRKGQPTRIRLGATAVRVEHRRGDLVSVTYLKNGTLHQVTARGVVMANGGWSAQRAVRDLPQGHHEAYRSFVRAPMLVVNVALRQWRFMYDQGITAAWYFSGPGFACNLRQTMVMGDYRPPLHPDQPTLLTFYIPFPRPGLSQTDQLVSARTELLGTSYRDYERVIRGHLTRLFGQFGFEARRDIAGIVLNRWGHAYVCPAPGFYYGRDGKPAARDVIRQPAGRIGFANAELAGHQTYAAALSEGARAVEQLFPA
ncbi:MAG TPA: NAD(P)-binding protein [Gemmatimonadales bacterium]